MTVPVFKKSSTGYSAAPFLYRLEFPSIENSADLACTSCVRLIKFVSELGRNGQFFELRRLTSDSGWTDVNTLEYFDRRYS